MHELSVCQSLLGEVERVAAQHGASDVARIVIAVGPLSGVEPELLDRAFAIARTGTVAASAQLNIETAPVKVWCELCDAETQAAPNSLLCGHCGTWKVQLRSGDELVLKRLELSGPAETEAAA